MVIQFDFIETCNEYTGKNSTNRSMHLTWQNFIGKSALWKSYFSIRQWQEMLIAHIEITNKIELAITNVSPIVGVRINVLSLDFRNCDSQKLCFTNYNRSKCICLYFRINRCYVCCIIAYAYHINSWLFRSCWTNNRHIREQQCRIDGHFA